MSILIVAEHDNSELKPATLNVVSAAQKIGGDIDILVMGGDCAAVGEAASKVAGISKVLVVDDASLKQDVAENTTPLLVKLAANYSHILAPATTFGKNIMPRVAALLDVSQISDISDVVSADTFERPIYAGNAIATVQSSDSVKIVTVRSTKFDAASAEGGSAAVENIVAEAAPELSQFVSQEVSDSDRPDLTTARIVVSGGRGMQSGDNFAVLDQLAEQLGDAAVGASRAAVDAGYVPNEYQVGQTGKVVAPDLYIAVAISGAIQHLAGMKDSKVIIAINKDKEAPIFQIADYGLEATWEEALPQLIEALK